MNNFLVNPNPFGGDINIFEVPGEFIQQGSTSQSFDSFNDFLKTNTRGIKNIACIVENLFYKNKIDD